MSKRIVSLSLVVSAAAAISMAAACSSSSSGSSGTPTPTSSPFTNCQVDWIQQNAVNTANLDVYLIDAKLAGWVVGTTNYTDPTTAAAVAQFIVDFDSNAGTAAMAGEVTNGSFSLSAASTTVGGTSTLSDTGAHTFYDITGTVGGTGQVGTGGAATFSGAMNDFNSSATPTVGTGSAAFVTGTAGGATTSYTISTEAVGGCYTSTAFDAQSQQAEALAVAKRMISNLKHSH